MKNAIALVKALADAIQELGEVPSGHLYASMIGRVPLETYTALLDILKKADLITVDGFHMIRWTGPAKG